MRAVAPARLQVTRTKLEHGMLHGPDTAVHDNSLQKVRQYPFAAGTLRRRYMNAVQYRSALPCTGIVCGGLFEHGRWPAGHGRLWLAGCLANTCVGFRILT